jgi:NitT/TauT family transport system permease protein
MNRVAEDSASGRGAGPRWSRRDLIGLAAVLTGIVVWELAARLFFRPLTLPPITTIAAQAASSLFGGEEFLGGTLLMHSAASVYRIAVGFALGSVLGVTIALAMGMIPIVHRFLDPIVNFIRFIPDIAWISPFLIWFGIGELSKVALITYTVMFMVLLNTLAGMFAIPRNRFRAARCMGANQWQIFCWVVVPATVRFILDGMRIATSNAFTTIVAAEMIAAQVGLGYLILVSRNFGGTDLIFLGMLVLGVLGFCADRLFTFVTGRYARRFYLP